MFVTAFALRTLFDTNLNKIIFSAGFLHKQQIFQYLTTYTWSRMGGCTLRSAILDSVVFTRIALHRVLKFAHVST